MTRDSSRFPPTCPQIFPLLGNRWPGAPSHTHALGLPSPYGGGGDRVTFPAPLTSCTRPFLLRQQTHHKCLLISRPYSTAWDDNTRYHPIQLVWQAPLYKSYYLKGSYLVSIVRIYHLLPNLCGTHKTKRLQAVRKRTDPQPRGAKRPPDPQSPDPLPNLACRLPRPAHQGSKLEAEQPGAGAGGRPKPQNRGRAVQAGRAFAEKRDSTPEAKLGETRPPGGSPLPRPQPQVGFSHLRLESSLSPHHQVFHTGPRFQK